MDPLGVDLEALIAEQVPNQPGTNPPNHLMGSLLSPFTNACCLTIKDRAALRIDISMVPVTPDTSGEARGVPGWLAILGLIFCFPVGIALAWLTKWGIAAKVGATVLALLAVGLLSIGVVGLIHVLPAQAGGGAQALSKTPPADYPTDLPLYPGARLDQVHRYPSTPAFYDVIYTSDASLVDMCGFLNQALRRGPWTVIVANRMVFGASGKVGCLIAFTNGLSHTSGNMIVGPGPAHANQFLVKIQVGHRCDACEAPVG